MVYDTLQHQESILEEEVSYQNRMEQQRMEYQYEQLYLMQQIQYYEGLFHTDTLTNLIQFAKEEAGATKNATVAAGVKNTYINNNKIDSTGDVIMNDDDVENTTTTVTTTLDTSSSEQQHQCDKEIVKQFLSLHGLDIDAVEDRSKIIAFIQSRMQERTILLEKIQKETKEIQLLRQEYNIQHDLLSNSIPTHIQTLERAATALSKVLYSTTTTTSSSLHTNNNNNMVTAPPTSTDNNNESSTGSFSSVQHMTGTDRIARIQMAQQLSSVPLYTIYQSIQHYFDIVHTNQISSTGNINSGSNRIDYNNSNATLGKVTIDNHLNEVILHLPVLDVAASVATAGSLLNNNKIKKGLMVSIHFAHCTNPIPYITTYCNGCTQLLNQDILLDELFPNDVAMNDTIIQTNNVTHTLSTSQVMKSSHPTTSQSKSNNNTRGKSYLWCNHLAGLYPVPFVAELGEDTNTLHPTTATKIQQQYVSTHIVIHEIHRRIRANATLKYVLHSLCRSRVPTPPLLSLQSETSSSYNYSIIYTDPNWKSQCKLISFTASTTTPTTAFVIPNTTTYNVEIRRNGNVAITAAAVAPVFSCTVQISNTCYPAVVPIWNFTNRPSLASNTMSARTEDVEHSYDTHIAQLAHRVNVDILDMIQKLSETQQGKSELYIDQSNGENITVIQFCEWILVHQLREVMHFVDSLPENSTDPIEYPLYKGRDRQIR